MAAAKKVTLLRSSLGSFRVSTRLAFANRPWAERLRRNAICADWSVGGFPRRKDPNRSHLTGIMARAKKAGTHYFNTKDFGEEIETNTFFLAILAVFVLMLSGLTQAPSTMFGQDAV